MKFDVMFENEQRRYEAVGFLNEDEHSVLGRAALERTSKEHGGAIAEDDRRFISQHLLGLPTALPRELQAKLRMELRHFDLVTGVFRQPRRWLRRLLRNDSLVSYAYDRYDVVWRENGGGDYDLSPDNLWRKDILVIRRIV